MLVPRLKNNGKVELWLNPLQQKTKRQIERKIQAGSYELEDIKLCAVCKGRQFERIGERDRYGLYYPVNICKSCGLLFVSPRLNQHSFNQFYKEEYRKLYLGTEQPTSIFFREQAAQGKRIYDFLDANGVLASDCVSVLEVGCGAGGILHYFREKGFAVEGIDLGEDYITYGKQQHGLNLHTTSLKNHQVAVKPDIIIYSHVLEHLLDLEHELALVRRISKPTTTLYIEVPSLKQMHKGYDLNMLKYFHIAHTYHFTLTTLTNLLHKNGFELLIGNEHVKAVFRQAKTVHLPIASDYKPAIKYIRKYEKLRWLFYLKPRALKYYTGMVLIKSLDRLGIKERIKKMLGR